jgi:hypothetical protein
MELCFWTFGLLVVLAAATAFYAAKMRGAADRDAEKLRERRAKALFYVLLFAYPMVCPPVIATFICRTVAGTSYLVADYTLQCHTPTWDLAVTWCSLWFVAYVIGLPVVVGLALYRQRPFHLGGYVRIPSLAFVSNGYRTSRWTRYWEVLEMARKLLLSSAILLFEKGTSMQIAVATVVSVVFLILHALYEPFEEPTDNRLQTLALTSLFGVYFIGLLIKVQPSAGQSDQFATLLTVLSLVVAGGAALSTGAHAAKKAKGLLAKQKGRSEEGMEMGSVTAPAMANPAYEDGGGQDGPKTAEQLEVEMAAMKREHAAELDESRAEAANVKAELALLKAKVE